MHRNSGTQNDLTNLVFRHNLAPLRPFDWAQGMLCGRISLTDRQSKRERAPSADCAFDPDTPSMQLDKFLGKR